MNDDSNQIAKSGDIIINLILVGESGVGKSSLLKQYKNEINNWTEDRSNVDDDYQQNTIGCNYLDKRVMLGSLAFFVRIWDSSGESKYEEIIKDYCLNIHGIILVYDISDQKTFEKLNHWKSLILSSYPLGSRSYPLANPAFMIVGNKIDKSDSRKINKEKAEDYAQKNWCFYRETSAATGENVKTMFFETISVTFLHQLFKSQQSPTTTSQHSLILGNNEIPNDEDDDLVSLRPSQKSIPKWLDEQTNITRKIMAQKGICDYGTNNTSSIKTAFENITHERKIEKLAKTTEQNMELEAIEARKMLAKKGFEKSTEEDDDPNLLLVYEDDNNNESSCFLC